VNIEPTLASFAPLRGGLIWIVSIIYTTPRRFIYFYVLNVFLKLKFLF